MSALIPINNINVNFEVVGDEVFATSLQIAEVFEKRHDHLIRTINNLPNDDFKSSNFKFDTYFDKKGEQRRMFSLTRDGFSLLVMGFTGEKAYQWKIEFIKAFNIMEAELRRQGIIRYVDKIADLEATAKFEAKRHGDQINGYLGQLAKHNALIVKLKNELAEFKTSSPRSESLQTLLEYVRKERDFYKQKLQKTEKEKRDKELVTFRALQQTKKHLERVYTAIGAVEAYVANDDRFFMEQNEILGG